LGTPPILWKARPARESISPSSAMSRSSALSAIFSLPLSPNARAISRLPAGSSDDWMKSSTCSPWLLWFQPAAVSRLTA
jgi:hypothetical protein